MFRRGSTVAQIHRATGVSRGALSVWFADPGRAVSAHSTCFVCGDESSVQVNYLYLLGQYLGDGHIATSARVPKLRIACANDYPAIANEVDSALREVSGNKVHVVQATGCSERLAYWKHWPCVFPQYGPGPKHRRPIVLTDWQSRLVEDNPWALLRGLIHSDGCRSINTIRRNGNEYRYPRYFFSNESSDIIGIFTEALDLVGVNWRMCRPNLVSVARATAVRLMDAHIGPKS